MIADLKPYEKYKESGLSWLGQVPGHWETRRAKFLIREVDSRSKNGTEQLLRVSQYTGVTQRKSLDGSEAPDTRAASLVGYKRVRPKDLVINIMLAWNGSMGVSRYEGIASPAYCVYRFNEGALPWYFHEVLRTPDYKHRIKAESTGVVESRLRLYSDDLGRIELPLPPPDEQAAIVRFLNWANGRLEKAIRAKRKVIALLNEQKQAIIHRAVTRGLNPNAPLKPSGIPWLGEIPAHWEVKKLRMLFRYEKGGRAAELTKEYIGRNPGEYPVFSGQTEDGGMMGKLNRFEFNFDTPVVFVSTVGARAMSTRLVCKKFSLSQNCAIIIPRTKEADPSFYENVFQRLFEYERASISLIMQPSLRFADLNRFYVPQPPISEQQKIAKELLEKNEEIEKIKSCLENQIQLLREYRTRLVADVVTGKLDVREVASKLPDEAAIETAPDESDLQDENDDEELLA